MLRLEEAEAFTRPSRVAQRQAMAGGVCVWGATRHVAGSESRVRL